jgi:hypothetical protein
MVLLAFVLILAGVQIGQLISALKGEATHKLVKKKLKKIGKTKKDVLETPLPRHEQDRVCFQSLRFLFLSSVLFLLQIKRKVAYESNQKEVAEWEPIVKKNRLVGSIFIFEQN